MRYINEEYWNHFYKEDTNLIEPSSFAQKVIKEEELENNIIVDLGCGTGKDTFFFSSKSIRAIGIDGSKEVIKNNINNSSVKSNTIFYCVDLSKPNKVKEVFKEINNIAMKNKAQILFYNRFFLHAISEDVENLLLENILENIEVPCKILSEFRTEEDEKIEKIFNNHYRRYINTNDFLKKILNYGFELKSFEKGHGYSIYKGEDPFLARVSFMKW